MKISAAKTLHQPRLTHLSLEGAHGGPLLKVGQKRNIAGRIVEEVTRKALGLSETVGTGDIVSDGFLAPDRHFEIKGLRERSDFCVYHWRLEKDQRVERLNYVIGVHRAAGAKTAGEWWSKMSDTLRTLLVVPAEVVREMAAKSRWDAPRTGGDVAGRTGYQRAGYRDGFYRIPWKRLSAGEWVEGGERRVEIDGVKFDLSVFHHRA